MTRPDWMPKDAGGLVAELIATAESCQVDLACLPHLRAVAEELVTGKPSMSVDSILHEAWRPSLNAVMALVPVLIAGPVVLANRPETFLLYWACQWAGLVAVPLSWRLEEGELDYCVSDRDATIVLRDGDDLPDGPEHPGLLDRDEREVSLLLYTSGTTGRPKGVPRSHRADRAGGWSQALQHGYGWGDRTLGVMPLYHTMGIHSLLAMHTVGGCTPSSDIG